MGKRIGRPPAGARRGEKVKDYPQLSVRMPPEAVLALNALSLVFKQPQWRVLHRAIHDTVDNLTPDDRKLFDLLVRQKVPRR